MASRKDKQARRLARKRKGQKFRTQQRNIPSTPQDFFKRVQSSEYFKNTQVIQHTGDAEKMSDIILRFAEPLKDENSNIPANMLRFAILVWNASLLPKDEQEKALRDIIKALPGNVWGLREAGSSIISMLLERKEKYFSDNKRMVVDYNMTETEQTLNLNVVSTVPKEYNPEL
jgi:hypothetical protein